MGCDTSSSIEAPDENFFLKYYGGEGDQEGVDAVLNTDGTITLFGNTASEKNKQQLYLVNIEQNGRLVWEKSFGGENNDYAKDIELTDDGRLVIIADTESGPGDFDIMIMTLSLDGNKIDSAGYSNLNSDEVSNSVSQTLDGFIVSGWTNNLEIDGDPSSADIQDALHLRFTDNLVLFNNSWPNFSGNGNRDEAIKVIQLSQSEFYIFGYTDSPTPPDLNYYVERLGEFGESGSGSFILGNVGTDEILSSVSLSPIQSGGEGFLLAGVSQNSNGSSTDIFVVKLRRSLAFSAASDIQFQKTLAVNLGNGADLKVTSFASIGSGFLILTNEKVGAVQNFYLTKIGNDGSEVWTNPIIFGGEGDSQIGSVMELPDGSIGIIGTFSIGQDGEKKMTFIKVNKDGKFLK